MVRRRAQQRWAELLSARRSMASGDSGKTGGEKERRRRCEGRVFYVLFFLFDCRENGGEETKMLNGTVLFDS